MTYRTISRRLTTVLATVLVAGFAHAQSPPQIALERLKTADGLQIGLFASEPLVNNPTAIDIDPMGRVWVAEGVNYRHILRGNTQGQVPDEQGDRIKVLEDVDGDGRADRVTVFADQLIVPMSVAVAGFEQPGKGGKVYVGESPNLWVFEDTDGDLVADTKEALLTGFGGKDHDHGIHGLVFGPDGRLYFTVGDEGMDVTDRSGERHKPKAGAVCRVNLDGTELTVLADNFRNPYEPVVDSFGEVFLSDNDIDGRQGVRICWVLEGGDYGWQGPPSPSGNHWREDLPGYVHKILGTGNGSPCGMLCYEGTLFGEKYVGALIHADAGPRVIRAYHVEPKGAGYSATPEVLVSSDDDWFRPVDVCTHPDGSIYIADWYDAGVGGHRYSDNDTGRIYRLLPKGKRPEMPKIAWDTPEGVGAALTSPNVATRFRAFQRSLDLRREEADRPGLQSLPQDLIEQFMNSLPEISRAAMRIGSRIHWIPDYDSGSHQPFLAVWTYPGMRRFATRLRREDPELLFLLVHHAEDEIDAMVQRELILATRGRSGPDAEKILRRLVPQWDGADHFYLAALGIALRDRDSQFVASIFEPQLTTNREAAMVKLAWELQRAEAVPFLRGVLEGDKADELKLSAIEALWHIKDPSAGEVLVDVARGDEDSQRRRVALGYLGSRLTGPWSELRESEALERALERALREPELAATAVGTIAEGQVRAFGPRLAELVADEQTAALLKLASIDALGRLRFTDGLPVLEEQWQSARIDAEKPDADLQASADPVALAALRTAFEIDRGVASETAREIALDPAYVNALRQEAVRLLGSSRSGAAELLNLAEAGQLPAALKGAATQAVHAINDNTVRARAEKLLPRPKAATGRPLPSISELVKRDGDAKRGREVFFREGTAGQASSGTPMGAGAPQDPSRLGNQALCSRCHRVRGEGAWVGPDLSQIGTKLAREALYDAILHPSAGIAHEYRTFAVVTDRGQIHTGLVLEDTPQRLVLKTAEGRRVALARNEIDEAEPQPVSLMPDNLTATLTESDLVDLVAYLETLKEPVLSVNRWHVLAPMDRPLEQPSGIDLEAEHDGADGKPIRWRPRTTDLEGRLELTELAGAEGRKGAYCYARLSSPRAQTAMIVLETSLHTEIWVNGEPVALPQDESQEEGNRPNDRRVNVPLKAGENELLVGVRLAGLESAPPNPSPVVYATLVTAEPLELR